MRGGIFLAYREVTLIKVYSNKVIRQKSIKTFLVEHKNRELSH